MNLATLWEIAAFSCKLGRLFSRRKPCRASVLLVEDDSNDAELAKLRLEKRGLNCEIAHSGEVAEGLVKHSRYNLVILDMRLPGMSGAALMRVLSKDAPAAELVICCGDPSDLRALVAGEVVLYTPKPINQLAVDKILKIHRLTPLQ